MCKSVEDARTETVSAYRRYSAEVLRHAVLLTPDVALAQDAVQESFLRLFLALTQGEEITQARPWLHRVAQNLIYDWLRSARAHRLVPLDDVVTEAAEQHSSLNAIDWMPAAQQALAPREWQCVRLRVEGMDYAEIATALHIQQGTVGALLNRATTKLRQLFREKERPT